MARPRRLQPHPDNPECPAPFHGDENAYSNADPPCRCPDAREHNRLQRKRGREHRRIPALVPAFPAVRCVRALAAIGHAPGEVAAAGGLSHRTVRTLLRAEVLTTSPATVAGARAAFVALRGSPGGSKKCITWARKYGWPRADEWLPDELDDPTADPRPAEPVDVDPVAVSEAAAGRLQLAQLSLLEQEQAVALARRELSGRELAERLGTSTRQVDRVQARARDRAARTAEREDEAS